MRSANPLVGHPRGLWVLAATELWDRISFHGMQAILTLYLASSLLLPGHVDYVVAFGPFRRAIESLTGPLTVQALATQTFGIYIALVYATPIMGGAIGDRLLSRRLTVTLGALMMTLGHFSLAFDASFLFGMLFLALGAGLLRGNLTPQVKALYQAGDRRQSDAFQIYALSVNIGAFIAPLVTGALAAIYGWHVGFAFAGFGMLIGLVVYLVGQRHLADEPRAPRAERVPLTPDERCPRRLAICAVAPTGLLLDRSEPSVEHLQPVGARPYQSRRRRICGPGAVATITRRADAGSDSSNNSRLVAAAGGARV